MQNGNMVIKMHLDLSVFANSHPLATKNHIVYCLVLLCTQSPPTLIYYFIKFKNRGTDGRGSEENSS